ncbi:MAG: chemotaxis protein CheA [Caldisericia bacterium]|nr:chemotaxis protein CheA [Caldisericia bacterium]HOV46984.1 chemotaxis protein CheA [Exilispira sp.]
MENNEKILQLIDSINLKFSNYEKGDLLTIIDLKDQIANLKEEFEKNEELNLFSSSLSVIIELINTISKNTSYEEKIINLVYNYLKSLNDLFNQNIKSENFIDLQIEFQNESLSIMQSCNIDKENLNFPDISNIKEMTFSDFKIEKKIDTEENIEKKEEMHFDFSHIVDDQQLLAQFVLEASEHLDSAQFRLIDLEYDSKNKEFINTVFRDFHTIKGSSAFLGLSNIEALAHGLEDIFALIRDEKMLISKELIDFIFIGVNILRNLLDIMRTCNFEPENIKNAFEKIAISDFLNLSKKILSSYTVKKIGEILIESGSLTDDKLKTALKIQTQEDKKIGQILVEEKMASSEEVLEAVKMQNHQKEQVRRANFVKVSNEKLNTLIDIVGELVINQSMLKQEIENSKNSSEVSDRTINQLEHITTTIKNLVLSMGMVPIGEIFNKLRIVVRNTASELKKSVFLTIEGEQTELDRNVIEMLYDPLMHILRNCIDHGIESAEERKNCGKNPIGQIKLGAVHKGSAIEIYIEDDGQGIDREKVKAKAIQQKLLDPEMADTVSDKDLYSFLFRPGFSTAEKVTSISGRGVGLDVVKKNIDKIHGRVEIQSESGKFTRFVIKLPLTLAIIEGFVTIVGENKYVFPFNQLEEVLVLDESSISISKERNEAILFHRGMHIPVIFAADIFNEKRKKREDGRIISLILIMDQLRYCIIIDDVVGKQEIVIKNLGDLMSEYHYFSGGTIFGDGSIGFVVDLQGMLEY